MTQNSPVKQSGSACWHTVSSGGLLGQGTAQSHNQEQKAVSALSVAWGSLEWVPLEKEELVTTEVCPRHSDQQLAGNAQRATSGYPGNKGTTISRMVLISKQCDPDRPFKPSGFLIYKTGIKFPL